MTAQLLITELGNILQESKKKHIELKNAADRSLQDLKALPNTSDAQIAGDLRRRPYFISPFVNATKIGNAKLNLSSVTCLHKLAVLRGIPRERLCDVLDAFQECSRSGIEGQLKILQCLPSLLQNYGDVIEGDLQASVLRICTILQQSKSPAVSSPAAAAFQQIVSSVFEKVELGNDRTIDGAPPTEVEFEDRKVSIDIASYDAYRVLQDLCFILDSKPPRFVPQASFSPAFGLELIEAILANHADVFDTHPELAYLLRSRVISVLTRFISEKSPFSITVRALRIFCIIIRDHLETSAAECEKPLSLLNHLLDSDGSSAWRRALAMETFRVLYSSRDAPIHLYSLFDAQSGRQNIIQDNLASFVRLAAEKPALIGMGQQSSYPTGPSAAQRATAHEPVVFEAGVGSGMVSGDMGVNEIPVSGISTQWSSIKVPCLDQLDKSEAPTIPDTYSYSIVLTCLNSLSNDLSKTVLPLSTHSPQKKSGPTSPVLGEEIPPDATTNGESQANLANSDAAKTEERGSLGIKTFPVNPLESNNHKDLKKVRVIAELVDNCWPAILAASSTFLYAALDAEFYRGLIRSMQKFTQIAGILRLATPRDAFLTTLAKAAVPPHMISGELLTPALSPPGSPKIGSEGGTLQRMDSFFSQVSGDRSRRESIEIASNSLSQRNLMCLRALTNLAISLGSILDQSWSIILESLQKADNVLANSNSGTSSREYRSGFSSIENTSDPSSIPQNMAAEISAVEAAVSRLFQSTVDYPDSAFLALITAMCKLIVEPNTLLDSSNRQGSMRVKTRKPSTSNIGGFYSPSHVRGLHFAIAKIGELARINVDRFAARKQPIGWDILSEKLIDVATSSSFENTARLMAADVLGNVAVGLATSTSNDNMETREEVQQRAFSCIEDEVRRLRHGQKPKNVLPSGTTSDVHRAALEALRTILEQCGHSVVIGWRSIFAIVDSAFMAPSHEVDVGESAELTSNRGQPLTTSLSPKTTRAAFASVQLICSDFLASIKKSRIVVLIDILSRFCSQETDLNVSLTAITLFWNLSDFLRVSMAEENDEIFSKMTFESYFDETRLQSAAESGSSTATWMILQRRLALLTADSRADVRNGVIQTVVRILGNCGDQMIPNMWLYCLKQVVLHVFDINATALREASVNERKDEHDDVKGLVGTANAGLTGISGIFTLYWAILASLPDFEDLWQQLLQRFSTYIGIGLPAVTTAAYNSLSRIISAAAEVQAINQPALAKVLALCDAQAPKTPTSDAVLVEYLSLLNQLYPLVQESLQSQHINQVAANIRHCAFAARGSDYVSDVETLTDVQSLVLQTFSILRDDLPNTQSPKIRHLSEFVSAPFTSAQNERRTHGPTYIAFAKQALDLLQTVAVRHCKNEQVFTSNAVTSALQAVAAAIGSKYTSLPQGKDPPFWRAGTTTAIAISRKLILAARDRGLSRSNQSLLWSAFLEICGRISQAPFNELPKIEVLLPDESFDLDAVEHMRNYLMISRRSQSDQSVQGEVNLAAAWLNDPGLPDELRIKYVRDIFQGSLIHDIDHEFYGPVLTEIYTIRMGSVVDTPFNPRIRMCYVCVDELVRLVSRESEDGGKEEHEQPSLLAREAFPYVILRAALPLKRYVADQPLRGGMPTPRSQRLELLYVLRKLAVLKCVVDEDACAKIEALPEVGRLGNQSKQHLRWLLPLVNQASRWARRDVEISDALQNIAISAHCVG